jgi:plastocyanin
MHTCFPLRSLAAGVAIALIYGCSGSSTSPASPSAMPAAGPANVTTGSALTGVASAAGGGRTKSTIHLFDACDPETFNAALGDGTCTRSGGVRFESFIEQLRRHASIGAWHFTPPQTGIGVGDMLLAVNDGGEAHTFTEVEKYGGGIVPMLNELTGLTTVAPECTRLQPADFIPPGGTTSETEDEEGVEKYQCCIHPWMRAEVRVGKQ